MLSNSDVNTGAAARCAKNKPGVERNGVERKQLQVFDRISSLEDGMDRQTRLAEISSNRGLMIVSAKKSSELRGPATQLQLM